MRHGAAQIWKERHGEGQSSMGDMERYQALQSGTKQDVASQSIYRHPGLTQIRMNWDRQHDSASDLNGAARAENSGTDLSGATTGIKDKDGVIRGGSSSFQIWS